MYAEISKIGLDVFNLNAWKVTFENPSERQMRNLEVEFIDITELFGHGMSIDKLFIKKLMDFISTRDNYNLLSNINKIISPKGEDLTGHAIFALLCEDKQNNSFSLLLGHTTEEEWLLLGIWPDTIAKIFQKSQENLDITLSNIIFEPDMWEEINLIMPLKEE